MAEEEKHPRMIDIDVEKELWTACYTVHSLVIIGSKEESGAYNFAPKHMAMPLGFGPYFSFIGIREKSTYQNVKREGVFTVSFPNPNQLTLSSLMATQREEDTSKAILDQIPTRPAQTIDGKFLRDSYFQLECDLHDIMGNFDGWELIVGKVQSAYVSEEAIRRSPEEMDAGEMIYNSPLLAYLHPDRFSEIRKSNTFPFPKEFKRKLDSE